MDATKQVYYLYKNKLHFLHFLHFLHPNLKAPDG